MQGEQQGNTWHSALGTQDARPARGWRVAWGPTLRMVLMLALGAMLVVKVMSGGVLLYVNSVYTRLIFAAGVALLVIGYIAGLEWLVRRDARPTRHLHFGPDHAHATGRAEAWGYALLAVPLLLGLLIPARPLGAAAVQARAGDAVSGSKLRTLGELGDDTTRWTLLDWTAALAQTADPRVLAGKPASFVGFVAGDAQGGGFTVARFVIVCCTADGNAVTLPVRGGETPPRDTWVHVGGALAVDTANGKLLPYIAATQVQIVPRPAQPYLYP